MSSAPLKNIIIAGATGSVGAPILSALLAEPSFNVTVLTRASSSAKFPSGVPVKQVSDAFTVSELTEAFKGQDAVVAALSTTPVTKDDLAFRIIDAAVAAGVKRLIPSEFGTNNLDPRARSLVPVYDLKGKMLEYLIKRAKESNGALTWTSISCGSWLDWGLDPAKSGNFLYVDVKHRKATIWDSGLSRFAVTTSTGTGLAVAKVLLNPELTANKQVFLSDFVTNSREIVASLERQMGEKFTVEEKESGTVIRELRSKFDAGDFNATYPLLALSFVADVDVGYDFEKEQEVWNGKLGLPKQTLDEVVKGAIELANST
ncbi:isoflavone reductase family protein [Trematosphaeria pertusa]|uniref:Isoflavone reductase family protein n=1 Tax=Trematosphaeria pertusa TaxID=390896 RepID=A0A6A6II00_9PLEO|nr:isoflavone reductase family protein [Trematosphaeria pertusa]KAF2249668.1 isoflavone reductase family protein [Trematosphaeria pertusa]